jgi:lipopolysaccharide export system permease protein
MPILLYTYLLSEILAPFFASLVIINGILFLGRLVPLLEIILGFGIGFADFIRICAYVMPKLFLFSIPMASMIGIIISFTRLGNDNELIALKAGGVGLYRMVPPVFIIAFVTAFLTGVSAVSFIPSGTVAMNKLLFQLAKEKIDKGMKEKQFSEGIKNLVLYVDRIDPENKSWEGVYVSDLRQKDAPLFINARTGDLAARIEDMQIVLNLQDGTLHRSIGDLTQTVKFEKYQLALPLENPKSVAGSASGHLGKNIMKQSDLLAKSQAFGMESDEGITLMIEFHKRLVLPVGCFILSLLALPLALLTGSGSERKSPGLPMGLGFFLCYYIMLTAAKVISENGTLSPGVAMWMPNLIFFLLTVYFFRAVANESLIHKFSYLGNLRARIISMIFRRGKKS